MTLARRELFDFPDVFRRFFDTDWDVSWLRVEEFVDGDSYVVRAELPDIDPEKDVEITVEDGALHIRAERREKTEHKDKTSYRSEFRYGSFARTIPLRADVKESDITATYQDGVLEIRAPMASEQKQPATKIPVTRR